MREPREESGGMRYKGQEPIQSCMRTCSTKRVRSPPLTEIRALIDPNGRAWSVAEAGRAATDGRRRETKRGCPAERYSAATSGSGRGAAAVADGRLGKQPPGLPARRWPRALAPVAISCLIIFLVGYLTPERIARSGE
jgi:hypothetical protein